MKIAQQLFSPIPADADVNFFGHVGRNHSMNTAWNWTKQIFLLLQHEKVFKQECVCWIGRFLLLIYLYLKWGTEVRDYTYGVLFAVDDMRVDDMRVLRLPYDY